MTSEHQIFCHEKDTYVCHICHTKCTSSANLSEHIVQNHDIKCDFSCSQCSHKCPSKTLLTIHLIETHQFDPMKDAELMDINVTIGQVSHQHVSKNDRKEALLNLF